MVLYLDNGTIFILWSDTEIFNRCLILSVDKTHLYITHLDNVIMYEDNQEVKLFGAVFDYFTIRLYPLIIVWFFLLLLISQLIF